MTISVLFIQGCPNHRPAVDLARSIVVELNVQATVEEVAVVSDADAERLHFLGSPTIRVNDVDIEPQARNRQNFGISCRTYDGLGIPPRQMFQTTIATARRSSTEVSRTEQAN